MTLNVAQRGTHVATFRWIEVRLMETLAAWTPTTPEMEAKLLFGAHIWDAAQHADILGKRAHELRLPLQHSSRPPRLRAIHGRAPGSGDPKDCRHIRLRPAACAAVDNTPKSTSS